MIFVAGIGRSPGYRSGLIKTEIARAGGFCLTRTTYLATKLVACVCLTYNIAPVAVTHNNGNCAVVLRQVLFEA